LEDDPDDKTDDRFPIDMLRFDLATLFNDDDDDGFRFILLIFLDILVVVLASSDAKELHFFMVPLRRDERLPLDVELDLGRAFLEIEDERGTTVIPFVGNACSLPGAKEFLVRNMRSMVCKVGKQSVTTLYCSSNELCTLYTAALTFDV
jgi:hypothetical protein